MAFDLVAYRESLLKRMNERYTITEVEPASVTQGDLGLDAGGQQPQSAQPAVQPDAKPKAKDPEISMEVLKGTVQWALGEKEAGKSSDEVLNQLGAMKKPGLIDFIHSYLQGSGQQAPTADANTQQATQQATGEPGAEDLSGLTQPEQSPEQVPTPDASGADAGTDAGADADLKL
jgi:hypothetical protein